MKKKKVSLADIAKSLGVSKTLVSLVLNNKARENGINEETEKKVRKKALELNYKPNQIARGLRTGKSFTLGLIVADISNSFYSKICRAAEDESLNSNYNLIFCSSDENEERELNQIEMLRNRQVDGIIVASTQKNTEVFKELQKEGYPFVLIDRYFPEFDCDYVVVDNYKGTLDLMNHITGIGYDKIGLLTLTPAHITSLKERNRGYKDGLKKNNVEFRPELVREVNFETMKEDIMEHVKALVTPPVSANALFVVNNFLAIYTMECINKLGLRIPEDVAVVCFDDLPIFNFSNPPITAVAQPIEQIGQQAVSALVKKLSAKKDVEIENQHIVLDTELVTRKSCGKSQTK